MVEATTTNARPTFLTVLCILSFIGCGIGIVNGIGGYFSNKALASGKIQGLVEQYGESDDIAEMDQAMELLGDMGMDFDKLATNSLVVGLLNILVLIGVLLMWRLRKTGFYLYTAGQVATIIAPFIFVGSLAGGLMATGAAFIAVVFVILYALNLKHLR